MNLKKIHSKDSLIFPPESYKYVTFLLIIRVEETMGVFEFHCMVAEGSGSLKILRYYGVGERVLSQTKDFQDETVHPREVMLTFLNLPSFNKKLSKINFT